MTSIVGEMLSYVNDPERAEYIAENRGEIEEVLDTPEIVRDNLDIPALTEQFFEGQDVTLDGTTNNESNQTSRTLREYYDQFLANRSNRSPATIGQYKLAIPEFITFAECQEITYPSELDTALIDDYVAELREECETDADILKWLNKRCEFSEAVYQVLDRDALGLSTNVRELKIGENEAKHIIQNLKENRRGSPLHAVMELGWNAGPRLGGFRAPDLKDFYPEENTLLIRHRPDQGTRLKNGCEEDNNDGDGERNLTLSDRTVNALQLYIDGHRPDITDEYGREPLFATKYGRASKSTLRRWIYEATSCRWAPENDDGPTCDGSCDPDSNVCPVSYYPHALRRGAIVNAIGNGLRKDRASERFDVSVKILNKHYDPREEERKRQERADAVKQSWSDW